MGGSICIIPARGGSKRVPRKNIKDFHGRPIIAYSIGAALSSGLFEEVIVSTDDVEIAGVAEEYGAKVPFFRTAENSGDFATLADVIDEVRAEYSKTAQGHPELFCCILPTAPLIRVARLHEAYRVLSEDPRVDSVRPVVEFPYPIQRALKRDVEGYVELLSPEHLTTRSQDLDPAYYDAGQFYFARWEKGLRGTRRKGILLPGAEAQDIDTLEDWRLAEIKYSFMNDE